MPDPTTPSKPYRHSPVSTPSEYAVLPAHAPPLIRSNTISIRDGTKIHPIVEAEKRRAFQALVRRYMNQLLYGCQREYCDVTTCYTARKRLARKSNASRRLTLLSARILACSLATEDDPTANLCPGKPVVPVLASSSDDGIKSRDSSFKEEIEEESEKENKDALGVVGHERKGKENEVEAVADKGLKDSRSFTQQLFNTVALKMVEWIGLPTAPGLQLAEVVKEKAPPKIKFPSNPMEVMDTGRVTHELDPVSQSKHQEILQLPLPRKRSVSLRDVVSTPPHANAKARLSMPPPPPPTQKRRTHARNSPQDTPTNRGEKHDRDLWVWEGPEVVASPQSLKRLDVPLCQALINMCKAETITPTQRREAEEFAKQSVFYVLSTPSAACISFTGKDGFPNRESVCQCFELLFKNGFRELVMRSLWMGLSKAFQAEGGLEAADAAGMVILSIHALAETLPHDEINYALGTEARAAGRLSFGTLVAPDVGFDDEMNERLMKKVLRVMAYRGWDSKEAGFVRWYLVQFGKSERNKLQHQLVQDYAEKDAQVPASSLKGWSVPRNLVHWTRNIFLKTWQGGEQVKRRSFEGACLEMFKFLHESSEGMAIPVDLFKTPILGERLDYQKAPMEWQEYKNSETQDDEVHHLFDFSYLFQLKDLITFYRSMSLEAMRKSYEAGIANIKLTGNMAAASEMTTGQYHLLIQKLDMAVCVYLVIQVRRHNLLEDAFNQLIRRQPRELSRPLKVRFADGEEGVDQGGVQQEFFSDLIKEIVAPEHGVFVTDDRTRISWFWEGCLEGEQKLEMIGLIVGLALYNGITLPVNFPKALYCKLLGQEPTLDDLEDGWPQLVKGFRDLLSWQDGDVGDVFVRTYEYSYDLFGEVRSIDMIKAKEDGLTELPRQIPRLKRKARAIPQEDDDDAEVEASTASFIGDWLPIVASTERDPFMGNLDQVLEDMEREMEREDQMDIRALERRRSPPRPRERRYTVSYRDLGQLELGEPSTGDGDDEAGPSDPRTPERNLEGDGNSSDNYEEANTAQSERSYRPPSPSAIVSELDSSSSSSSFRAGSVSPPLPTPLSPPPIPLEAPLVTNANRAAYVTDYIHWLTHASISPHYHAFARGFFTIISRPTLSLFTPTSLQSLLEGANNTTNEISITSLQEHAKYEDGYHADHRIIKEFWEICHTFDQEMKRRLLEFVTSSSRVPAGGMQGVMFYVTRNGRGDERLPSSLTCFGRLLLPEYSSKEVLERMLRVALEHSRGFGSA